MSSDNLENNSESDETYDEGIVVEIENLDDLDMYYDLSKIEENLFLGGISIAKNQMAINRNGIKRILSLIQLPMQPDFKFEGIQYKHIFADDDPNFDLLTHLPECIKYITDGIQSGQAVYVHCMAGISRSATVVTAFLMNKYKISYSEAFKLVKSKRYTQPNEGFVQQLLLFEEMKYTLDANNRKFRRFLIRNLRVNLRETLNSQFVDSFIDKYYQKLSMAEAMTKDLSLGRVFECIKCNHSLFHEINVLKNENPEENRVKDTDVDCDEVYVEPQKWMSPLFGKRNIAELDAGLVNCPKCGEQIGQLDFYLGIFFCECPLHVRLDCLIVKIHDQKYRIRTDKEVPDS